MKRMIVEHILQEQYHKYVQNSSKDLVYLLTISDYFSKDDFLNAITNPKLKSCAEKEILKNQTISSRSTKNRIKL